MHELIDILNKLCPKANETTWRTSQHFVKDGLLDSLDIITLYISVTDHWNIKLTEKEMNVPSWCNLAAIRSTLANHGIVLNDD